MPSRGQTVRRSLQGGDGQRALSPVIGIALMIAIVIGLVVVTGYMLLGTTDSIPGGAPQMAVEWEETELGLVAIPQHVDKEVDVNINGEVVTTIDQSDIHSRILLPVAPDDRLTFVADVGSQTLLQARTISESEAGDFIAYYTFEEGSGTTVQDRSANDNDATMFNGPTWISDGSGSGIDFDGSDDYLKVDQLNAKNVTNVAEFTVAVKYQITGSTTQIQQLVEHRNATTNFEWFLETKNSSVPYYPHYTIWPNGVQTDGVYTGPLSTGQTHVLVGTYDQEQIKLYLDGQLIGTEPRNDTVEMGTLFLGADAITGNYQHLNGRMYQFRLYYSSFSSNEVDTLTSIMETEAE